MTELIASEVYYILGYRIKIVFHKSSVLAYRRYTGGLKDVVKGHKAIVNIYFRYDEPRMIREIYNTTRILSKKYLKPSFPKFSRWNVSCGLSKIPTDEEIQRFLFDFEVELEERISKSVFKKEGKNQKKDYYQTQDFDTKCEQDDFGDIRCYRCGRVIVGKIKYGDGYDIYTKEPIPLCSECYTKEKRTSSDNSKKPHSKTRPKFGWMSLFIAILLAIFPIFTVFNITTTLNDALTYNLFNLYPGFYIVSLVDVSFSLFLVFFSLYAGLSLYLFKHNAVYKAKAFLGLNLIYSIIAPFLLYFADFPAESMSIIMGDAGSNIIRALIFFGVWFWFLSSSDTVKRLYYSKWRN